MYKVKNIDSLLKMLIFLYAVLAGEAHSLIRVDCRITTDDGSFTTGNISVSDSVGSPVQSLSVSVPDFSLTLPGAGSYGISVNALGNKDWERQLTLTGDTTLDIRLVTNSRMLQELTVTGNTSSRTTATGEVFRLSRQAKASGDPYMALSEIPILDVNVANQSIRTRDGSSPLILIDGKYLNSGVNPIDPRFIESVEVMEVTNAKYLQMGFSSIVNITLKRDVPSYTYVEARTRHDIPPREGFGGANFEFGTPRFAVSGNLFGKYLHKDKVISTTEERLGDNSKESHASGLSDMLGWDGYLMMKWIPTKDNYFAATVKGKDGHTDQSVTATGFYNSTSVENLSSTQKNRIVDGGMLAAAYYEHTFSNKDQLTSYFHYNRGFYDEDNRNDETITEPDEEEETSVYWNFQKSVRDQYVASVDYNSSERRFGSLSAGNEYRYTRDRVRSLVTEPNERRRLIQQSNYTYISYNHNWERVYMMLSAGIQYMDINAENARTGWWRPRISGSVTWRLGKDRKIRGSYTMNNSLPPSAYMQRFNTSVDPWVRIEGNPYLVPMRIQTVRLNYDKSFSKIRLNGYGVYRRKSDMIESYIRNEENVSVHTYRNNGVYHSYSIGVSATVRFGSLKIMANVESLNERYQGQGYRHSFILGGNGIWTFGKFFIYADINWRNRDYSPYSITRYRNPLTAHIQLTWRPVKPLQLTLGLPYFWGVRRMVTTTEKGEYFKMSDIRYKSESLRPWILISWTLRKNAKYKIADKIPNL